MPKILLLGQLCVFGGSHYNWRTRCTLEEWGCILIGQILAYCGAERRTALQARRRPVSPFHNNPQLYWNSYFSYSWRTRLSNEGVHFDWPHLIHVGGKRRTALQVRRRAVLPFQNNPQLYWNSSVLISLPALLIWVMAEHLVLLMNLSIFVIMAKCDWGQCSAPPVRRTSSSKQPRRHFAKCISTPHTLQLRIVTLTTNPLSG